MPEVKNIFVGAKMNKDLNPRMISNQEYIDARNAAIINSEGSDSGLLQNVSGNTLLTDFGLTGVNLEIIGFFIDTTSNSLFCFVTDWNDTSSNGLSHYASINSHHYICRYDTITSTGNVLVSGSFLNFSKNSPIYAINLIENLLFFTDNRNQPRKINVSRALNNPTYYTKEEHISVAKYYPWKALRLSKLTGKGDLLPGTQLNITTNATGITNGTYDGVVGSINGTAGFSTSGNGEDLILRVLVVANTVVSVTVNDVFATSYGFAVGDTITISNPPLFGASNDLVITLLKENFNQESTMKDVVSEKLPKFEEKISSSDIGAGNTTFNTTTAVTNSNPSGLWYGCTISGPNLPASAGVTVVSISNLTVTCTALPATTSISSGETIVFGANPYYDVNFKGDTQFLSDKFVRFSYRFKYDDDEYSLMAPFSQAAFIPKQDGYFLSDSVPADIDSEVASNENEAIKSTIVSFFENKINQVELIIDLPEGISTSSDLSSELKVKEIEILCKESDGLAVKVIDVITLEDLSTLNSSEYIYKYTSESPIRTLPSNETGRASDKVPIRAKAQEITGNRVIYGNYLVRTARPTFLDYSITAGKKYNIGQFGSINKLEYPNHTLKQNRSYKVGIVLSDKFGRQSDVIVSENSTIYNPYIDSSSNFITSRDTYYGDSLKINWNNKIPSEISSQGYAGLYSETNPLGWYTYKIVVQQKEQDYYNVYIPTILNNNPQNVAPANMVFSNDIAFITLFSDNINKIPRDLNEVGPNDRQFSSSVNLFTRVQNDRFDFAESTTKQFLPSIIPDKVVSIGTRDELGLDVSLSGSNYSSSPFYGIPLPPFSNTTEELRVYNLGANPYIANIATEKKIGSIGGSSAAGSGDHVKAKNVRLNVCETEPFKSNLDIYYETSSSGLISELNESIEANFDEDFPATISNWTFTYSESNFPGNYINTDFFDVLTSKGESLTALAQENITAELVSVRNGIGDITSQNLFEIEQDIGASYKWKISTTANTYFVYDKDSSFRDKFSFTIRFTYLTASGKAVTNDIVVPFGQNILLNAHPQSINTPLSPLTPKPEIITSNTWADLYQFNFKNGTSNFSDKTQREIGLKAEVVSVTFDWVAAGIYANYPGTIPSDPSAKAVIGTLFRFVSSVPYGIPDKLQYSNQLICLNTNSTTQNGLTNNYFNRVNTNIKVVLRITDASGGTGSLSNTTSIEVNFPLTRTN